MDDARRRQLIASATRARLVFALLALALPLLVALLFERQERRLRALADHGRTGFATLTHVTRTGSGTYAHYQYEVDGERYTWSVSRAEAPYPPGNSFDITYLPEDPSLSRPGASYSRERLEGELHMPIRRGVPLGLFAFFGVAAALCHRHVARLRRGTPMREKPLLSPEGAGRLVAALLVACLLGVNLDPKVRAVQAAAFGEAPLGLPVTLVVCVVELLLFAPYFWVFPHLMGIVMENQRRGGSVSKLGVARAVVRAGPEWRRSRMIVVAGFVYFVALMAAWIAYAQSRGI